MKKKTRRLYVALVGLCALGAVAALVLAALEDDIVFFFSPTEIMEKDIIRPDQRIRIGGLVEAESVTKAADGVTNIFNVTDMANTIRVEYKGILPDLFREGQGVVTEGYFKGKVLIADEVLAKHDENYMPPEVAEALKKSGKWEEGQPISDALKQGHVPEEQKDK
ncbi:periplasmic heme chaperone [Candidatus Terasakiella magnetica]|uniref:Cytochrome c-type biogenesis protein CcmE n=1 Tax=Candidatus Terasakiella magnetica TaxID=1867952 RepID=A0A1C3RIK9_9PROT|nr:cytochrome c maturation protein CcmE [Candidatus Terasakiella magnetica]SCA57034.1 periplasmic heme chaperone [Candidatus Terasakiella magnetica]